jgi:ElaB/YqjD/DUF883 family membrane-anchored ribosome-binding protein
MTSRIQTTAAQAEDLTNRAADSAEGTLRTTRRVANETIDHLESAIDSTRDRVQPAFSRLATQAEDVARRSLDAVRESAANVRERAVGVGDATVRYVKDEPVKSVLIAAAAGAALMGILSLIQSSRRSDR